MYASKSGGKIEYSIDGQQVNSITYPPMVFYSGNISENNEAGYIPNLPGNDTTKIIIFNPNGTTVKEFNCDLFMVNPDAMSVWDIQAAVLLKIGVK